MRNKSRIALSSLTLRQQRTCALYWYDGLTQAEIGRRYGMTRSGVAHMIASAKAGLRRAGIQPPRRPARMSARRAARLAVRPMRQMADDQNIYASTATCGPAVDDYDD